MLSTIATFKENLSQIAMDVQDAAEELEISGSLAGDGASVSDRRASHRFAQSKSSLRSSSSNGIDESFKAEIEQYKAEIKRLQVSEAEIKAMSINYAAILKEKEEQLVRLHEENGYMKKNLEATNAGGFASRNESLKIPANSLNVHKGDGSQSNMRQHKHTSQASIRPTGNLAYRGILPKNDGSSNGSEQATQSGGNKQNMELKDNCLQGHEKGLANLLKENQSMAALKAACESEIKQLKEQLDKDRVDLANTKLQLQGEHEFNESSQKEIDILKMDKDRVLKPSYEGLIIDLEIFTTRAFKEMKELHDELNNKISEIRRLQSELNRRDMEESVVTAESMKRVMEALEKENTNLKSEKDELVDALQQLRQCIPDVDHAVDSKASSKHLSNLNEVPSSGDFLGKEDTAQSQLKWEQSLNDACRERDKALQELARLKQHLLDKELEESDKMDEDRKLIEELQTNSEVQKAHILQLQKDLKQAISNQEEVKKINSTELQKAHETINDLKHKLASCMKTVDSKNVELLNLQTALGQYYAESEAKERLECDLAAAREELANHSELLKNANQRLEASKQEKDDLLAKLSKAERTLSDGQYTIQKLEEDNLKLRRALDQSMTRLNRMSMDSDYFVDRRIVIKLLVTYFQRNHSKEVLDLMVRMLGFSDEDKQRIGFAQQVAGKGVVRGVLGLPGRLVGGILGGSSSSAHTPSENQSFADLWVDFLLKETEERERRETAKAAVASTQTQEAAPGNLRTPSSATVSTSFQTINPSIDSEFSNVPLTSTVSPSPEKSARLSRLLLRY